jgi:hypothetical protein
MNKFIYWLFLQHPNRFVFILFYVATGLIAGALLVLILALLFLSSTPAKMILLAMFMVSLISGIIAAVQRQEETN